MVGFVEAVVAAHVEGVLDGVGLHARLSTRRTHLLPHHPVHPHLDVLQRHLRTLHQVLLLPPQLVPGQRLLVQHLAPLPLHLTDLVPQGLGPVELCPLVEGGGAGDGLAHVLVVEEGELVLDGSQVGGLGARLELDVAEVLLRGLDYYGMLVGFLL